MSNKPWPDKGETVSFQDLTKPLIDAVLFAYKLERRNEIKDIPWNGLDIGEDLKVTCFSPSEQFSAANLRYSDEDQGRTALEEIIGVAVQLGMEQGKRHFINERMRFWGMRLQMAAYEAVGQSLKECTADLVAED